MGKDIVFQIQEVQEKDKCQAEEITNQGVQRLSWSYRVCSKETGPVFEAIML